MSADPIFLPGEGGPVFSWLHLPESGAARGGVVLCPPLGLEAYSAYPVYRELAERLARAGVAALRLDYRGTGNSAGGLDRAASAEAWVDDVRRALNGLRSRGVEEVAVCGLRLGAVLAAEAARRDGAVAAAVLWDPVETGRAFLRHQRALKALSLGDTPDPGAGWLELAAMLVPAGLAEEVAGLRLGASLPGATRTLVVERSERPLSDPVRDVLAGPRTEWRAIAGQDRFMDVEPGVAVPPAEAVETLVSWFDGAFAPAGARRVVPGGASTATFAGDGGAPVIERAVRFGPAGAFGILSEPPGGGRGPAVVLASVGPLHHVGPGRVWVELARLLAADGRRVLRFDLGGLGDSPPHPGRSPQVPYPADGVADVLEAARAASPWDPRDVVLAGICSGAYHAAEAARQLLPAGVALVNPVFSAIPPELREPDAATGAPGPNPVLAWMRRNRFVVAAARVPLLARIRGDERLGRLLDDHVPERLWHLLGRAGLVRGPSSAFGELAEARTDVLLVCGRLEARPYRRARGLVAGLEATGTFRLEVLEEIDHSLFGAAARIEVGRLLVDHLRSRFPLGTEAAPVTAGAWSRP